MQTAVQRGLGLVNYRIDAAASRFTVQTFSTGLLSTFGHDPTIEIQDYVGEIQFVPDTYEKPFVRVTVRTSAMQVLDEMKKDDRRRLEREMFDTVLETQRFPEAVFESKEITIQRLHKGVIQANVTGELSFHGVMRGCSFDVHVAEVDSTLRINGEFSLRLSDYSVRPVSFAAGALRLKDDVKYRMNLVAHKED